MSGPDERGRKRARRAVAAAIALSIALHAAFLALALAYLSSLGKDGAKDDRELVFLEQPPAPAVAPDTGPAPPAEVAPPKRAAKRPTAPAAAPDEAKAPDETPLGSPDAPASDEPIATSPDAPKDAVPGLPPGMTPDDVRTNLSWNAWERAFEETARTAREAYEAASMEKRRGGMRFGSLSGKVKAAMENHRSWIAEGNPEPLTAAEVAFFRGYLESTHDKIHQLFADSFLVSLNSLDPSHPLNNMDLMTRMEFEILADGRINEVHVLRSSGNAVFDAAAVDSLYRSSPFIPPPKEILSWNNRAYFRWGFYRNQRKCGVFNAEPYRLRAPGAAPEAIPENTRIFTDG